MVRLISKHIGTYLLTSTVFLTLILVTGVWLTQSLRFIEIIVNQNVSIGGYFSLVGFLIPDLMVIVLPVCILISTIFTYNKLIADNEMAVFRSCGLSNWQIAKPALFLGLIFMVLSGLINIYLVPLSFRHFRDIEYDIRTEVSANVIREGTFNNVRDTTIFARKRGTKDDLYGIFIHHTAPNPGGDSVKRGSKGTYTIVADHGFLSTVNNRLHLILFNGHRQEKEPNTGRATFFHFAQLTYDLTEDVSSVERRIIKPYERPLSELLYPPEEENISPMAQSKMRAEAHQRIISPFMILLFSFIACAIMITGHYNRRGRRLRIISVIAGAGTCQILIITLINVNNRLTFSIPLAYVLLSSLSLLCLFIICAPRPLFNRV